MMYRQGNNTIENENINQCLANYLLPLKGGERILSARELADYYRASLGSISFALNYLEEIGAVTINRRGRLGSFLEMKSLGTLWNIIEHGPMVISLTLPSFPKSEGLATAVYSLLDNANVETYLIFIRGSINRIKALRNGRCHAAVMSALAADNLCTENEECILKLPPQTFVTDHRIFYKRATENTSKPLRVGIDMDSFDVRYLTELEFAESNVEFCPVTFMEIDRHMEQSTLDAAISNLDNIDPTVSKEISSRPLSLKTLELIGDRNTSATFIVRAGSTSTKTVLKEILDPATMIEIQQKVVARQLVPRY